MIWHILFSTQRVTPIWDNWIDKVKLTYFSAMTYFYEVKRFIWKLLGKMITYRHTKYIFFNLKQLSVTFTAIFQLTSDIISKQKCWTCKCYFRKTLLPLDKHLIMLLHANTVHEREATLHEIYNKLMWFEIVYVWEEWQGIRERER